MLRDKWNISKLEGDFSVLLKEGGVSRGPSPCSRPFVIPINMLAFIFCHLFMPYVPTSKKSKGPKPSNPKP